MKRRRFLDHSSRLAAAAFAGAQAGLPRILAATGAAADPATADAARRINVAFVISDNANVIDLAGPWEVFQDVMIGGSHANGMPFRLYTVSDSTATITATGGLKLVPHYTLRDAPKPQIISVGAQRGSRAIHQWLGSMETQAEVIMSVCTGAFQLGRAGLLDGKRATTHHQFWDSFAREFPKVELVRGSRFVENGRIMTAGGLTSGIDLALHVVSRYFGAAVAEQTAVYMEHQSTAWQVRAGAPR